MVDIICIIFSHLRGTVYERWLPHRWGLIRVLLVARACSPNYAGCGGLGNVLRRFLVD